MLQNLLPYLLLRLSSNLHPFRHIILFCANLPFGAVINPRIQFLNKFPILLIFFFKLLFQMKSILLLATNKSLKIYFVTFLFMTFMVFLLSYFSCLRLLIILDSFDLLLWFQLRFQNGKHCVVVITAFYFMFILILRILFCWV